MPVASGRWIDHASCPAKVLVTLYILYEKDDDSYKSRKSYFFKHTDLRLYKHITDVYADVKVYMRYQSYKKDKLVTFKEDA